MTGHHHITRMLHCSKKLPRLKYCAKSASEHLTQSRLADLQSFLFTVIIGQKKLDISSKQKLHMLDLFKYCISIYCLPLKKNDTHKSHGYKFPPSPGNVLQDVGLNEYQGPIPLGFVYLPPWMVAWMVESYYYGKCRWIYQFSWVAMESIQKDEGNSSPNPWMKTKHLPFWRFTCNLFFQGQWGGAWLDSRVFLRWQESGSLSSPASS